MKLYVVRHGKTNWNATHKMQGMTDVSINAEGRKQAELVKEKLKDVDFDLCISSPLLRTRETAEIIVGSKCNIIIDDLLIERDMGLLEGKDYALYSSFGYWDYNKNSSENGVESIIDILERAKKFLDKIMETHTNKTILVVSHGALIRAIHYNIVGYDENTDFLSFSPANASVYEYDL